MRSEETLLLDMLIAARKIQEFTAGIDWETFKNSRLHQSAVIREIQVIGEAARLVTETIKSEHPEVEWSKIAGMRNRVIHQYFRVDLALVWDTIQEDVEPLIEHLQLLVPPDDVSSNIEP